MIWSPQQEEARRLVSEWRRGLGRPYFVLAGYAGTGKTTLASSLAEGVRGPVYFASYTGKAAHVLRQKGIAGATTIHKLIYLPRDKCDERLKSLQRELEAARVARPVDAEEEARLEKEIKKERANLSRPDFALNYGSPLCAEGADQGLVVVDEYSMVSRQVGADLLSFGVPVLALGDPAQLPPVRGDCYFSDNPDFLLLEIHRHAVDNPIIRMSMDVRLGRQLPVGEYGESRVLRRRDLPEGKLDEMLLAADQILVGYNETRRRVNQEVRRLRGYADSMPVRGDKLVCLRNNADEGLLNGQIWEVAGATGKGAALKLRLKNDDGDQVSCHAHRAHFEGRGGDLDPWTRRQANEFDFGYALTVHKAQGSQWDRVLLYDEWVGDGRARWLYTALTRAAKSVTVVR